MFQYFFGSLCTFLLISIVNLSVSQLQNFRSEERVVVKSMTRRDEVGEGVGGEFGQFQVLWLSDASMEVTLFPFRDAY